MTGWGDSFHLIWLFLDNDFVMLKAENPAEAGFSQPAIEMTGGVAIIIASLKLQNRRHDRR